MIPACRAGCSGSNPDRGVLPCCAGRWTRRPSSSLLASGSFRRCARSWKSRSSTMALEGLAKKRPLLQAAHPEGLDPAKGTAATMANRAYSLPRPYQGDGRTSRASLEGGYPAPLNATNLWGGPHDRPVHRERLEISGWDGRGFDGEDTGRCDHSGP